MDISQYLPMFLAEAREHLQELKTIRQNWNEPSKS